MMKMPIKAVWIIAGKFIQEKNAHRSEAMELGMCVGAFETSHLMFRQNDKKNCRPIKN